MSKTLPIYIVDAFTSKPYAGNPAGVCLNLHGEALDVETCKKIAAELKHSETAFVTPHADSKSSYPIYGLRWFTPTTEVNLCGHATLATAHVMFNEAKLIEGEEVHFSTKSGILTVRRSENGLTLDFPRGYPLNVVIDDGIMTQMMNCFKLPLECIIDKAFCAQTKKLIVEIDSMDRLLAAVVPDENELTVINYPVEVRGIALTCSSRTPGWNSNPSHQERLKDCDLATRYFSPWNGIPEDPVNGSSHTILPHYYSAKLGKTTLRSHAASSRHGYLTVSIPSAADSTRVFISGNACTVLFGQLSL